MTSRVVFASIGLVSLLALSAAGGMLRGRAGVEPARGYSEPSRDQRVRGETGRAQALRTLAGELRVAVAQGRIAPAGRGGEGDLSPGPGADRASALGAGDAGDT